MVADVIEAAEEGFTPDETAAIIRSFIGLTSQQTRSVWNFYDDLIDQGIADDVALTRAEMYADAALGRRAETIARTELISATNAGQQALWDQAVDQGVLNQRDMRKVWIVTDDDRLEEDCEALADVEVGIDEPFDTAEGAVMFPPLHPRCRCAIGLVNASTGAVEEVDESDDDDE